MFRQGIRTRQAAIVLAGCLLLAAGSGCGARSPWSTTQERPLLERVKVSELQPGCYCEIDMFVPPLAPEGSVHAFNGTVKEITHEEIVLVNALEQSNVDYVVSTRQRPLTQQKRELVGVPLLGISQIWAYPPGKDSPVRPTSLTPSPLPAPAATSFPAEALGSPTAASQLAAPPPSNAAAHFDAPPGAGYFTR